MINQPEQSRPTKTPVEAVIYCRVGSISQIDTDNASVLRLAPCRKAASSSGLIVTKEFTDLGISGRDIGRSALDAMLKYLADSPQVKSVIVTRLDQLSRDQHAMLFIEGILRELEVDVLVVNNPDCSIRKGEIHNAL
jgi:DNA invertase Pin-like site-specific DNA recombinase